MRIGKDIDKIKQNQLGFIDNIILPLWASICDFFPQLGDFLNQIEDNKEKWHQLESLE